MFFKNVYFIIVIVTLFYTTIVKLQYNYIYVLMSEILNPWALGRPCSLCVYLKTGLQNFSCPKSGEMLNIFVHKTENYANVKI